MDMNKEIRTDDNGNDYYTHKIEIKNIHRYRVFKKGIPENIMCCDVCGNQLKYRRQSHMVLCESCRNFMFNDMHITSMNDLEQLIENDEQQACVSRRMIQ